LRAVNGKTGFAVLTLAEIKAAVEDFDRGDTNLFDALARIKAAVSLIETAGNNRHEAA
jgi:hypothetical protein